METPKGSMQRWWIYQRERFPLFAHGLLIAVFAGSALGYTRLLIGLEGWPDAVTFLCAFLSSLGFFLLLRIADEFKDYEDDMQFRAYRPVPRGLIALSELKALGIFTILLQVGLALWLLPILLLYFFIAFGYFLLMSKEFFVHQWLKEHPLMYLFSHMLIMPLIALYASAHQWLEQQTEPPMLLPFLAVSFFSGIVLEIGRKIRAPEMEETGVETYSVLWGRKKAVIAWLLALSIAIASTLYAAALVQQVSLAAVACLVFAGLATVNSIVFLKRPSVKGGKRFEHLSGLWTLTAYACLGIMPLILE